jgi:flagellar basal-body rod protein FlgB
MSVKPSQFDLLSRLLDVTAMRHQVIGQNVANVNTPGFRQQELEFEDSLKALLEGNRLDELGSLEAEITTTEGLPERSDGNNVDIDLEMSKANKNALLYEAYTQILFAKLGMVRSAINGQA